MGQILTLLGSVILPVHIPFNRAILIDEPEKLDTVIFGRTLAVGLQHLKQPSSLPFLNRLLNSLVIVMSKNRQVFRLDFLDAIFKHSIDPRL